MRWLLFLWGGRMDGNQRFPDHVHDWRRRFFTDGLKFIVYRVCLGCRRTEKCRG